MTRQEAIDEGGFIRRSCWECGKGFWSDGTGLCEMCRIGHIEDDEKRQEEEVEALDWDSLMQTVEEGANG